MSSFGRRAAVALALIACSHVAPGQALAMNDGLPNAPSYALQAGETSKPALQGTSQVQGVVEDSQGSVVPGAKVVLTAPGILGERTTVTGGDGVFTFTDLPAGRFRLIVSAAGMSTYTSNEFPILAGQKFEAPKVALNVSTSSSVDVTASPEQVAQAQVQQQEQQRVLGVFPNFYTSYIWKAEPMSPKQKYKLAFRALIDPVNFLIVSGVAGAEQFNGTYPGYGPGIEGYGKRYAAAYGDQLTSRIIGSAILPSLLHQDPRYFYQGSGGVRSRTWHALASTLVCRGDNGKTEPNYSHVLGSLAAGGIANAYHPESSEGLGLTVETLGITTGANAIGNLVREFVLRGLVPSVPNYANGR
ncbi:MAG: carboxypeptidase-like regulatory domain-containing protein [Acidobacteriota bacterium]|nr:carboxypeptidase-like regulatory domain-containing protein [Acidobacteriota bacterium]